MAQATGWNFRNSYTTLPEVLFTPTVPTPVSKPTLLLFNHPLAASLGLDTDAGLTDIYTRHLSGNEVPEHTTPVAQAYMGHQFGYLNMLGDGRAILLGEHSDPAGNLFDIQLKGSGPTHYSRRGDGRATLSACLREYIMSEAMFGLGIATSRSLAVVASGEPVFREQAHDGGILTRVMSSHIRVGTFEFATRHLSVQDMARFLDYVIHRHYPHLSESNNKALDFLKAVMQKQAALICEWLRVGFIHGVMNTDNMSIPGETFDYGPCAFMNAYDPATVFSSIDTGGRYAYGNQPVIAQWNLSVLAGTLIPLIHDDQKQAIALAKEEIHRFPALFEEMWLDMMCKKVGIFTSNKEDKELINKILHWMKDSGSDYTNTFKLLEFATPGSLPEEDAVFREWYALLQQRYAGEGKEEADRKKLMAAYNPVYIPRNHLVEEALEAATLGKDFQPLYRLLDVLSMPYKVQPGMEKYRQPPAGGDGFYKTFCNT